MYIYIDIYIERYIDFNTYISIRIDNFLKTHSVYLFTSVSRRIRARGFLFSYYGALLLLDTAPPDGARLLYAAPPPPRRAFAASVFAIS